MAAELQVRSEGDNGGGGGVEVGEGEGGGEERNDDYDDAKAAPSRR